MPDETVAFAVTSQKRLRIGENFYEHGDVIEEELSDKEVGILLRRGLVAEVSAGEGAEGAPDPADTLPSAGSDEPDEEPGEDDEPAEEEGDSEEESEFPKRVGESSMYELSNGEKVRGKAAAQHAEKKLSDDAEEDDEDE